MGVASGSYSPEIYMLKTVIRFFMANPLALGVVVYLWCFWVLLASATFFAVGVSGKLGTWNPVSLISGMTSDIQPLYAILFVFLGLLWSGIIALIILGPSLGWISSHRPERLQTLLRHTLGAIGKRLLAPALLIAFALSAANAIQGLPWSYTQIILANLMGFLTFSLPFLISYILGSLAMLWVVERHHRTDMFRTAP